MTLQSSGAISFSQLQTEYGGANPIGLNEYYRNDNLVNEYELYSQYSTNSSARFYWWRRNDLGTAGFYYNTSSQIGSTYAGDFNDGETSAQIGDFYYARWTLDNTTGNTTHWRIKRKYVGSANNNVPQHNSGLSISMNDFYGGEGSLL